MSEPLLIAISGLTGVIVTALFAYLVAKRKNSGSVDTSEAATLWAEAQAMRKELRDEVVSLRAQLEEAQKDIYALTQRIKELEAKQ